MLITADWPAPPEVLAFTSTRQGGISTGACQGFNLGDHVGDAPAAVQANRAALQALLPAGTRLSWLQQCHGIEVVEACGQGPVPTADASWTARPGIACAIMTADCLPVLLCDRAGSVVAAAHAGWRGLQAGILEATVKALPVVPGELLAWLGPAIGPDAFEVGAEVRAAFCDVAGSARAEIAACFRPSPLAGHYLADLYALARLRLRQAGVTAVYGGGLCTFGDAARFYSYRRDGQTGRMATLIQLKATPVSR
ncbi:peptidoglycan editing factor PgeF [Kineobactrum sediminis]|uniref:Purine nucleoside phosphorylase n=1 Tax=Kineobactrum sediminis TaxID=1905677 RepID=A0A2N5XZP6_9GAMM|nr:peptidoglycan editing factor PgeF [Kineobactrum sediminis]PLW81617.1 peptidoglycan editing factor PgeF [Kineobactrum sediminis]